MNRSFKQKCLLLFVSFISVIVVNYIPVNKNLGTQICIGIISKHSCNGLFIQYGYRFNSGEEQTNSFFNFFLKQPKKVTLNVKLVWSGTNQGIEGAELRVFDGTRPLVNKKTSDLGYVQFELPRKKGLSVQVKHRDLQQNGQIIDVQDLTEIQDDSADLYRELYKKNRS